LINHAQAVNTGLFWAVEKTKKQNEKRPAHKILNSAKAFEAQARPAQPVPLCSGGIHGQ